MITAVLLLTNMFTQRFMVQEGAHIHVAGIVEKILKRIELKILHHAAPYIYFTWVLSL